MSDIDEIKKCPYCGIELEHPYWAHVQEMHPEEYAKKETWIPLYRDYASMGMEESMCIMVISELFNVDQTEIKSFLKKKKVL